MSDRFLDVLVDGVIVGQLHDTNPLSFVYDLDCINGLRSSLFSSMIPVVTGVINNPGVTSFFENLLPEGDERSLIESRHHVSTIFGLLSKVGMDAAGSVVIIPHGEIDSKKEYMPVTWAELKQILDGSGDAGLISGATSNVSAISGAQSKMLIAIDDHGNPLIPKGGAISTHILKPDIARQGMKIWSSAVNETMVMNMAGFCGLNVAEAEYHPIVHACMVKRYDRLIGETGVIRRIYQADLCQLLGYQSTVKYENDGGPSFKDCYATIKRKSSNPAVDCRDLISWLFFNLYTGNNDSHAKNISMIFFDKKGLRLAPFYDLMCTRIYSGLSPNFAFKIGSTFNTGNMSRDDLIIMAKEIGVSERYIFLIAKEMSEKVLNAIPLASKKTVKNLKFSDKVIVDRLVDNVRGITKKMTARLLSHENKSADDVCADGAKPATIPHMKN